MSYRKYVLKSQEDNYLLRGPFHLILWMSHFSKWPPYFPHRHFIFLRPKSGFFKKQKSLRDQWGGGHS